MHATGQGSTTMDIYHRRHTIRGYAMITAQELRDIGDTLSWDDYTIGLLDLTM